MGKTLYGFIGIVAGAALFVPVLMLSNGELPPASPPVLALWWVSLLLMVVTPLLFWVVLPLLEYGDEKSE